MFKKIVVGTDGFGPASRAVARAADLAEHSNAELLVVYSHAPIEHAPAGAPLRDPAAQPSVDAARGLLQDVEKKYSGRVSVRTLEETGDPAEVLVDIAEREGVDLIVVGNKGMSKRFHLGVVPDRVSHHAPCNVLIVKTTE